MPALDAVSLNPYLRDDLSLVTKSGYDSQTRTLAVFVDEKYSSLKTNPSKAEAEAALFRLIKLLDGFEFKHDYDKACALAAFITAVLRPRLRTAPLILLVAYMAGSGKSYLASLIAAFATPGNVPMSNWFANDEECQKALLAMLMTTPGVIHLDNLVDDIQPYQALCTATTEPVISGRLLGHSKIVNALTNVLILLSGNNIQPTEDMIRRILWAVLEPESANPESREFDFDPLAEVRANREHYVSDVLTIVCAWIHAGKPRLSKKPIGSFQQWSDLCREPLLWLGQSDPAQRMLNSLADNPGRTVLSTCLLYTSDAADE